MRNLLVIAAVIFLAGCAVSKATYLPDGSTGHSINCSGQALTWGHCMEKAGELCGAAGYEVVSRSGDQGATVSANQYGLYGGSVINRSMLVKCKSGE